MDSISRSLAKFVKSGFPSFLLKKVSFIYALVREKSGFKIQFFPLKIGQSVLSPPI